MKKLIFLALLLPVFSNAQSVKQLDIKNGFLKFHLGDSLSVYYHDIYVPEGKLKNQYEVKETANPLHKYTDKVVLIAKKGIVTEIDVFLRDEASIRHIDKMLTQAYGPGNEIPNPDKDTEGTNLVCTTWKGERVLLMQMQHNINHKVNGIMGRTRIQALLFTKIGDTKPKGDLPDGFAL
jgi:hypothetical protein